MQQPSQGPPELQHLGLQEGALDPGGCRHRPQPAGPPEHGRCDYRYKGPRGLKDLSKRCCQQPLLGRPLWCPQYPGHFLGDLQVTCQKERWLIPALLLCADLWTTAGGFKQKLPRS